MADPLVSIAVPTRNRVDSLRESLRTILGQQYAPLEILISDNCSDDGTEAYCRELAAADPRVRYVRQQRNIGLHGNHNYCLDHARGELICVFHDHDTRDPGIVRHYVDFLAQHPRVGVVCSDWDLINDADERIGVRDHQVPTVTPGYTYIAQTIRSGRSQIGIPGAMVRRSALGEARFVHDAPTGFGDFAMWAQVAETWDVGHIRARLWSWRQNDVSTSARTIVSISDDYEQNLGGYLDEHLKRWPDHAALVAGWREDLRRYLFWALMYEVSFYFRPAGSSGSTDQTRTLFEIMDYRLTPEQFQQVLTKLRHYRSGMVQRAAFAAVTALIRVRLTRPLGWATQHHAMLRGVLGLK